MTISSSTRTAGPFLGDGSTTALPFGFKVFATTDVLVQRTSADGAQLALTLGGDYTVALNADQNAAPGGVVTLLDPAVDFPTGSSITLTSAVAATQPLSLANGGPFLAKSIEDALDRLTLLLQQQALSLDGAVRAPLVEALTELPAAATRRGKMLAFDASTGDLVLPSFTITQVANAVAAAYASGLVLPFLNVLDFGAVGDGVTDDTAAIQAALDAATGNIVVPPGTYLLSDTLTFPSTKGIALIGVGESRQSANDYPVRLTFTHASGPAVRLMASGQSIQNMVIEGTGARALATLDATSFGVLVDGPDTSTGSPGNCSLRNVFIAVHPSHALMISGRVFMLRLDGVAIRDVRGHGIFVEDGTYTGRTNTGRPGGIIASHIRTYATGGHDVVLGNLDDYGCYRFHLTDADFDGRGGGAGAIDASIKLADAACVFHGENITVEHAAFSGRLSGTPTYAAFQFSGRVHRYNACRYVGVIGAANAVVGTTISTDDIHFDGVYITSDSTANPAISITGAVGSIIVTSPIEADAGVKGVTNWFTDGYVNGVWIRQASMSFGGRLIQTGFVELTGDSTDAVAISRADAVCGLSVTRTGWGAASGTLSAVGGTFALATTSDSDLVLTRNNTARLTFKSATVNIASLPTSSAGLAAGDLWNDSGTLKVA